jgi:hypothetical protein
MRLRLIPAFALIMATATFASQGSAQGYAPDAIDATFDLPAAPFACDFPVRIHIAGKSKAMNLPGDRMIVTAPGQTATVTNLNNGKQLTVDVTGVYTQQNQSDGGYVGTGTGRNLVTDPGYGLMLVIGRFSFAVNGAGTLIQGFTLQGGQTTSVCSLIG